MKKLLPKTHNCLIVNSFHLECLDHIVRGNWLTDQMWDRYINKNQPISYSSCVDAVMLHHAVPTNNEIKNHFFIIYNSPSSQDLVV